MSNEQYGRSKYADHIRIYLSRDNDRTERKIMCINCGHQVYNVYNRIVAITNAQGIAVAELPVDVMVIEHKCRWCSTYFLLYR